MLPGEEMFLGRGGHSSILYLGITIAFTLTGCWELFFFFFGTTNKEARGWVWEGNYFNGDPVIAITSILGKRDSRRKMDGRAIAQTYTFSLYRAS